MGRYSDSEEERKRKKKSKRRSPSRSSSIDSHASRSSKAKKSKKSKRKRKTRSRSRSAERYRSGKKSRSGSRDRRRSRSRSKPRSYRPKSRSPSPYKSKRRSKSRSPYKSKRSRSRSSSPRRKRSYSKSPRRRSRSPKRRTRSRSRDRSRRSRSKEDVKREKSPFCAFGRKDIKQDIKAEDPSASIPGFDMMSADEQSEARLQLALRAAAAAGEKLKEQGVLPTSLTTSYIEQQARTRAIEGIESESFTPAAFRSSKDKKNPSTSDSAHDSAIFGLGDLTIHAKPNIELQAKDTESLMHPNLYISSGDKMQRWIKKLGNMRKKKLERGFHA